MNLENNELSIYFDNLAKADIETACIDYFKERVKSVIDYFTIDNITFYRVFYLGPMTADNVASLSLGEIDDIINVHLRGESFVDKMEEVIQEAHSFGADIADCSFCDNLCLITIKFKDQEIKETLTLYHNAPST